MEKILIIEHELFSEFILKEFIRDMQNINCEILRVSKSLSVYTFVLSGNEKDLIKAKVHCNNLK